MFKQGSPAAEFGLKVLLPTVSAAVVIAVLLYHVLNVLLGQIDAVEQRHARRAAQAFVLHISSQLEDVAVHMGREGASIDQIYGGSATRWMEAEWTGKPVATATIQLLSASGETLAGLENGQPTKRPVNDILSAAATALVTAPGGTALVKGIDIKDGTFRTFAAVHVAGPAQATGSPAGGPRIVLLSQVLDAEAIRHDGRDFGLQDARLVPATATVADGFPLLSPAGAIIGELAWTPAATDDAVRGAYGKAIWAVLASLYFVIGMLIHMSWRSFRQVSEVRAEAVESALRDDLTGLPNRRSLIDLLAAFLASRKQAAEGLSVVYADLDGFKEVNDSYGHEIGDLLLMSAAGGFKFIAQDRGTVARLGGDEFAVLVQGKGAAVTAREIAQNMLRFLAEPIVFGGRVASVSVSAGIVDYDAQEADLDAEEMLRRADAAMYAAKSGGRNRIQVYEPSLDSKREESRRIARELRGHIDAGQLGIVYQPIVDARTRQIAGVEALVRWPGNSPRSYGPDVFVPVAEEFGMIEDLGYFVMLQACRQAAQWPHIFLSVNVSPIQFMNPSFVDTVERILRLAGLEPQRLEVEVTEGFIIDNAERAASVIARLHAMHVAVALDDFGTGYSSIGHLRRFRFDKLKLDRSMVTDILVQPSALRLVQGTIAMADALGLRVTAEGVEDENQVSVLRLAGCSQFQGYLFSRPVEGRQITAILQTPQPVAV